MGWVEGDFRVEIVGWGWRVNSGWGWAVEDDLRVEIGGWGGGLFEDGDVGEWTGNLREERGGSEM